MKTNAVFLVNAIVSGILGLVYFLIPQPVLALQGITLNEAGLYIARTAGGLLLGYAATSWFVRNLSEADAKRAVVPGYFAGFLATTLALLWGQLAPGAPNTLGWANVLIGLLFTLAYGYFLFVKR